MDNNFFKKIQLIFMIHKYFFKSPQKSVSNHIIHMDLNSGIYQILGC